MIRLNEQNIISGVAYGLFPVIFMPSFTYEKERSAVQLKIDYKINSLPMI